MSRAPSEESFDHLFRRYRRDAILLHHPYPPHAARRTGSKFGGLPTLPPHLEWPRTPNGTPLHFFAQVDCADIPIRTALPERGVLFFFGRDDGEQGWDYRDPASSCRVLYALDGVLTPREAPDDLGPIGGWYGGEAMRDFQLEEERGHGPNIHVEWPIQPFPIDTWPGALHTMPDESDPRAVSFLETALTMLGRKPARFTWQEVEARGRRYKERLEEFRAEAFARATGEHWDLEERSYTQNMRAGREIFEHAETGPEAYPQHWISIHYAVRAILHRPSYYDSDPRTADWLRRSNDVDLEQPVSEEDRREFRTWLTNLGKSYDQCPIGNSVRELVALSLVGTIRAWAGDPRRAARVAPHIYASLRFYFSGMTVWGWQYAQMLGHAPSSQSAQPVDDPTVCLLNLASSPALGTMFGDVGHCTFWIEPEDLARRDFSKVVGYIQGG